MFTFGYKTSFSSILRALATIGIGLVMIFDNAASGRVWRGVGGSCGGAGWWGRSCSLREACRWFMVSSVTKGTGCFH